MSHLHHVVYAGQTGDSIDLRKQGVEGLEAIHGGRFKRFVVESVKLTLVDYPADMEEMLNTLDDLQIPAFSLYSDFACAHTIVSFIVSGDNKTNPELLAVLNKVNSKK